MEASAKNGFTNATDAADYLVNHGVPFRDAHGIVGQLVLKCIELGTSLDHLPLAEYQGDQPCFPERYLPGCKYEDLCGKAYYLRSSGTGGYASGDPGKQKISGRELITA